jgi:hypothetical protein
MLVRRTGWGTATSGSDSVDASPSVVVIVVPPPEVIGPARTHLERPSTKFDDE